MGMHREAVCIHRRGVLYREENQYLINKEISSSLCRRRRRPLTTILEIQQQRKTLIKFYDEREAKFIASISH